MSTSMFKCEMINFEEYTSTNEISMIFKKIYINQNVTFKIY